MFLAGICGGAWGRGWWLASPTANPPARPLPAQPDGPATRAGARRQYTEAEFEKLVLGLTPAQLRATLGAPDQIVTPGSAAVSDPRVPRDANNQGCWTYEGVVIGRGPAHVWIYGGHVDQVTY